MTETYCKAIGKPKLLMGLHKKSLLGSLIPSLLVAGSTNYLQSRLAGLILFAALMVYFSWLLKKDPRIFSVRQRLLSQKSAYLPGKRQDFRVLWQ